MVQWINNTFSPWLIVLVVVGGGALLTWIAVDLRHRRVKSRKSESGDDLNDLTEVFVLLVVGMYGILAAFTILIVWTNVDRADRTTSAEGGIITALARQSLALPQPGQHAVQAALSDYAESVIRDEWPTMAQGKASSTATQRFNHLFVVADSLPSVSTSSDINTELADLSQARTARLLGSNLGLPGIFWVTLLIGAGCALTLSVFFFAEAPKAHGMMAVAAAVVIFASLALILVVDYPFSGVSVRPEAFESALSSIRTIQSGAGAARRAPAAFRLGLVLDTGGRDDEGFNNLAYQGALIARTVYGVNFDYTVASTSSTQVYARNLAHFARQGYDPVIGVGFPMAQAMLQIARAYPRTHFGLIDAAPVNSQGKTVLMKNVANLLFEEQQSGYLVGYMAGLMEKEKVGVATHNTVGVMGGTSIPPVNRYIAGYIEGARVADPDITILHAYNRSFTATDRAHTIGLDQIARGADILFQVAGSSGLGYLQAAQQKRVYGIGADADQAYLGSYIMTSAIKSVDRAVVSTVDAVVNRTFKGGNNVFGLRNNATGYATVESMVPRSIVVAVNAQKHLISAGRLRPTTVIHSTP